MKKKNAIYNNINSVKIPPKNTPTNSSKKFPFSHISCFPYSFRIVPRAKQTIIPLHKQGRSPSRNWPLKNKKLNDR